ncbi:unnamed protein product, partial [Polarella glacialis]
AGSAGSATGSLPRRLEGVPDRQLSSAAAKIIQEIDEDLLENFDASEEKRKVLMRKYLMRWHPDKNAAEDKETATEVIQYLNSKKVWFLESAAYPETAPLLA